MHSQTQLSNCSCTGVHPCLFYKFLLFWPISFSHTLEIFWFLTPSFPSKQTQRHGWERISNSEWKARGNICGNTWAGIDVVDAKYDVWGVHQCIQLSWVCLLQTADDGIVKQRFNEHHDQDEKASSCPVEQLKNQANPAILCSDLIAVLSRSRFVTPSLSCPL